jgi:hypothetical protein
MTTGVRRGREGGLVGKRVFVSDELKPGIRSQSGKSTSAGWNPGAAKASDTEITASFAALARRHD